jgi:two-component system phosphate regulon response regulator OmpR
MAHTIAIVDDEVHLAEAVAEYLQGHGFTVFVAHSAAAFRAMVPSQAIDVALLDIAMPGEDGLSLARWLRRHTKTGIIFASASGSPMDRIIGLEIGADDYLSKPYDLRELLARIRSLLRRLAMNQSPEPEATTANPSAGPSAGRLHRFGPYVLDVTARRLATQDGGAVDLTSAEFDLLEALAQRPNRILTRSQLGSLVGDDVTGQDDRRIDVRITRLRRKIEPTPDTPRFIRTVRGEGYAFTPDEG